MIDKVAIEKCCLCMACSGACANGAIHFTKENNGFYYPEIDYERCVSCDNCEKVCPVLTKPLVHDIESSKAFAARSKDIEVCMRSTSGGIFFEAAKNILKNGGYVCGAVFTEDYQVCHMLTNKLSDLERMLGSKYAQSNTEESFPKIRAILEQKKLVLFCGCPCQCAGLRCFLEKQYDNLLLIDIVCHGVPSGEALKDYLATLEKRIGSVVNKLQFRNKVNGWHQSSVYIEFENGKKIIEPITINAYMRAFLNGTILKESCYSCQFKKLKAGSDITLGDFWGAEVTLPELDDNTGLSAVFVNTEKGMRFLKALDIELIPAEAENIIKYNHNVFEPSKPSEQRKIFYQYAQGYGLGNAIEHFFQENRKHKFFRKTRYLVRCVYYKLHGKSRPIY